MVRIQCRQPFEVQLESITNARELLRLCRVIAIVDGADQIVPCPGRVGDLR
ncbi:MAG: hypothetical protein V3T51_04770 [Gammaproteobacteria bacterium]